VKSHRIHIC